MSVSQYTHESMDFMKESHEENLFFPGHDDTLHVDVYDKTPQLTSLLFEVDDSPDFYCQDSESALRLLDNRAEKALLWCGTYTLRDLEGNFSTSARSPAGVFSLKLPARDEEGGPVTGSGIDSAGDFTIVGRLEGPSLVFNQKHISDAVGARRWQGTINEKRNEVEGSWGPLGTLENSFDVLLEDSGITSRFSLHIAPFWIPYLEPLPGNPPSSRPRLLWHFAIKTVVHLIRISTGHFSWPYLKYRREVRKRFLELYGRLNDELFSWIPYDARQPLSTAESEELANISALCSDADLRFYRTLCTALQRRRIYHW